MQLQYLNISVWCLVRNGGMDPYSSPYIIPSNCLHNPFPHSLLRTRQISVVASRDRILRSDILLTGTPYVSGLLSGPAAVRLLASY